MGKNFGGVAASVSYELLKGRIFLNQKNLVSIQVQVITFFVFKVPVGRTEQCCGLQFIPSPRSKFKAALLRQKLTLCHTLLIEEVLCKYTQQIPYTVASMLFLPL